MREVSQTQAGKETVWCGFYFYMQLFSNLVWTNA